MIRERQQETILEFFFPFCFSVVPSKKIYISLTTSNNNIIIIILYFLPFLLLLHHQLYISASCGNSVLQWMTLVSKWFLFMCLPCICNIYIYLYIYIHIFILPRIMQMTFECVFFLFFSFLTWVRCMRKQHQHSKCSLFLPPHLKTDDIKIINDISHFSYYFPSLSHAFIN